MKDDFMLEVLYSVFVTDTEAFSAFIATEYTMSMKQKSKSEREKIMSEIEKQLNYIFKKIIKKEDACSASSKLDILLNTYKVVFKD